MMMLLLLVIISLILLLNVNSFVNSNSIKKFNSKILNMNVKIDIVSKQMPMTETLRTRINDKMGKVIGNQNKFFNLYIIIILIIIIII